MANHPSAEKRHRQSLKLAEYNRWWKSRVKTASKQVVEAAGKKDKTAATTALVSAMKEIGKAKGKGVLHKATASRKISRLSKLVSSIQA